MLALAAARTRSGRGGALLCAQQRPRFVPTRLPSWHPTTSQAHICAGCPKVPVKKGDPNQKKHTFNFPGKKRRPNARRDRAPRVFGCGSDWPRTGACVGACAGALVAESAVRAGESMSRRAVKKNNGGKVSLTAKIGGLTF